MQAKRYRDLPRIPKGNGARNNTVHRNNTAYARDTAKAQPTHMILETEGQITSITILYQRDRIPRPTHVIHYMQN